MARVFASMTGQEPLPSLSVLTDDRAHELELRGVLVPAMLAPRWDRIEGERFEDHGDIGVDARGVYLLRHPDMVLADMDPAVAEAIDRFRRGQTAITVEDEERSALALDIKLAMKAAVARASRKPTSASGKPSTNLPPNESHSGAGGSNGRQ